MIDYTNHRGERRERRIVPYALEFETSEWHPEPQWVVVAKDLDKDAVRSFPVLNIHGWHPGGYHGDEPLWGEDAEAVRVGALALLGHHPERGGQERDQAVFTVIQAIRPHLECAAEDRSSPTEPRYPFPHVCVRVRGHGGPHVSYEGRSW